VAETRAYKKLKAYYKKAHWQRFESWSGVGVFDANACFNGREIWVEFKEVIPPKKLTNSWIVKPKVRPSQIAWQALKQQAGGITYVAIMIGQDMYILPGWWLAKLKAGVQLDAVKANNVPIGNLL